MRPNLNRLLYFTAILDEGSITAAANRLGVGKAVVSKQIQLLEAEVGQSLLLRNTRRLSPTEAGRQLYDQCSPALTQVATAIDSVSQKDATPRGRLRITAPVDLGLDVIAPMAARFREEHPQVQLDLFLTDDHLDPVAERLDLSFTVGWLRESDHLARKLADFREIVVASPETAAALRVTSPDTLAALPMALNRRVANRPVWTFTRQKEQREVALSPVITANITLGVLQAVRTGRYITILPDFLVTDSLRTGELVQLLPDWSLRTGGIYTVTPAGQIRSNALKAFLAAVRKAF
ncbi:LysR family transcriptional regulator [Paracoccus homiensis]|uniref:DNA-binding transcriptional regulator, LysR family n=1 Tax=Paracoccus homiensis TaxID=364199 RepID=A0A1I0HYE7_9RHOB|nr:LysR family transcriptional regulator [Paracoccus homiensis]SET88419.1 DNA-binding transcriptional regulator, LysR family [Paracoccus homiensis]